MLGQSTHASLSKSNWISIASDGDLRLINLDSRQSSIIKTPFSSISVIRNIDSERVAIIGASPTSVDELAILRLSDGAVETVKKTSSVEVEKESISVARSIEFPAKDGTTSHAYLYMPTNKGYVGEESTLPPVSVSSFKLFFDTSLISTSFHCSSSSIATEDRPQPQNRA